MMKRYSTILAVLLFAACKPGDKKNGSVIPTNLVTNMAGGEVKISGTISGLDSSGYLELISLQDGGFKKDSIKYTNGSFSYTAMLSEPVHYALNLAGEDEKPGTMFFADPGTVTINGNIDSLDKAKVTGGVTQAEYKLRQDNYEGFFEKANTYYEAYSEAREKGDTVTLVNIQKTFDSLAKAANQFVLDYASNNRSSLVAVHLLNIVIANTGMTDEVGKAFTRLAEPIKNSFPGRQIQSKLDAVKNTSPGAIAMNFTQNDTNGKPISLSSFKGKYLLIDFWASWCAPCRAENPNVVKAYNAYKTKGFEILGISLDDNKADWLAAIKKDNLTWIQVSDLKGWQNRVAEQYGVQSIPTNFLLDKDGNIIATNLRGESLENKLQEIMP